MIIHKVDITNFRNISQASFFADPHLNCFVGSNGAGKTTILEALHVLGHGRSFRGRAGVPLIQNGSPSFTVFASHSGERHPNRFGFSRDVNGQFRVNIDGNSGAGIASIARYNPIVTFEASSLSLVEGPPAVRRAFLDWLVFHVKHSYAGFSSQFRRVLKQRNSLLKSKQSASREYWDSEFVRLSGVVTENRRQVFNRFFVVFKEQISKLLPEFDLGDIDIRFISGEPLDEKLSDYIVRNEQRELREGRSVRGAQNADLLICVGGVPIKDVVSRGQLRLIVASLIISQAKLYNSEVGQQCVLLLDDMPAELDMLGRQRISEQVRQLACQTFVTGIEASDLTQLMENSCSSKMFHVKHGVVSE